MNQRFLLTIVGVFIFYSAALAQKTSKTEQKTIKSEVKRSSKSKSSVTPIPEYFKNGITTSTDSIFDQYFGEYYIHLLNHEIQELDQIEKTIESEYPEYLNNFYGYFGLRRWIASKNSKTNSDPLKKEALAYFQKAGIQSVYTPAVIWRNLALQIEEELPYSNFDNRLEILSHTFQPFIESGSIQLIPFSRKTNSRNLLLSHGSDQALKVLEWNFGVQKWEDISPEIGLNDIKGGNKIYAGDINHDGIDDFVILRNQSNIYRNLSSSVLVSNNKGTYTDISPSLYIDKLYNAQFASIIDINQDGKIDLIIGNQVHQTLLLLQDDTGKFIHSSSSLVYDDYRNTIQDGLVTDLNGDGHLDLLLTAQDGDNIAYLQHPNSKRFALEFTNHADSLNISFLNNKGHLFQGQSTNSSELTFILTDVSHSLTKLSKIFTADHSLKNYAIQRGSPNKKLPNELSAIEAGVWIHTFDGMRLLFSGGKNIESRLPFFEYNSTDQSIKIAQHSALPFYVSSVALTEYRQQPVFIFTGGGDAPNMKTEIVQLAYRPDTTGQYHRIFDVQKEKIGSILSYSIIDTKGKVYDREITVKSRGSKGQNILQEWIWLPKGYSLNTSYFHALEAPSEQQEKIDKKDFQPRITPMRTSSPNDSLNRSNLKKSK